VAPNVAGMVRSTGGWLFDRVMAGWDVMALITDLADSRPLQILGARAADMEAALTSRVPGPKPHALAVDVALYESDDRIHRMVVRALDHGLTEVLLWGEHWPADLDGELGPVHHRLSVAARAFKAQALAAAAVPSEPVGATEVFHSGELLPYPPGTPDLVSAN
jgi:hypothetical protein